MACFHTWKLQVQSAQNILPSKYFKKKNQQKKITAKDAMCNFQCVKFQFVLIRYFELE